MFCDLHISAQIDICQTMQSVIAICMVAIVTGFNIQNAVEVRTPSGWVRGYEENYKNGQLYRFIKIPYAESPIGELRFRKTRPVREWVDVKGIKDVNAPQCPQVQYPIPGFDTLENDEDCLYLNVYVPGKISKDNQLSVMVWIHGGGFMFGGASQYKPQKIVLGGDVIVVTINYRLGLLGFLNLHDPLAPGNYGLWDQIEALRWIQNNIAAFGGNPQSVTIFGQSAGGISASIQALIPSNEGLFQRAISQSGVASFFSFPKRKAEERTNAILFNKTKCNRENTEETLKCLRELPVDNITEAIGMTEFSKPLNVSFEIGSFVPSVDGELVKENLAYPKSWDNEIYSFFRSIDFMSGTLDGEGGSAYSMFPSELLEKMHVNVTESVPKTVLCEVLAPVFVETVAGNKPSLTQEICDYYTTEDIDEQSNKVFEFLGDAWAIAPSNFLLSIHAKNNNKVKSFQYLVTKPTPFPLVPMDPPAWLKGAGHGDELHLLFEMSHDGISEEKLKNVDLAAVDKLSNDVIYYWTNFAKFGNPNSDEVPVWPSYGSTEEQFVILDIPITTGKHLKSGATKLIHKIMDEGNPVLAHDEL